MIRLHCGGCGKALRCPDTYQGLKAKCPNCGYSNIVPKEKVQLEKIQIQIDEDDKYLNAFCFNCGSKISKYAEICPKCGCKNTNNPLNKEKKNRVEKKSVSLGFIVVTYLMALFLPIVGFICGIVIMCKGEVAHGILAIIISLFSWWSWAVLLL